MLEKIRSSTLTWEEQVKYVEKKIEESRSTALKGIPGPLEEPDGQEDLTPTTQVRFPLPRGAEESFLTDGDDTSWFAILVKESDGFAAEAETPPCNSKVIVPSVSSTVRLPPFPSVNCRIIPTGEATFNLQWEQK